MENFIPDKPHVTLNPLNPICIEIDMNLLQSTNNTIQNYIKKQKLNVN